ncbi:hypothetical protein GHJ84_29610 [Sinorhizobium meliloti]|uniref:Imm8 family immunity protein n=1 Tax=Rhizobium meliloti TaxID=382 RepID=UPI00129809BE|nr:Imm8 family immunity protein [Sinorhizobium meliloti]MQX25021.1 hypothetical protein [Sinorhizobium meliloti]
MKASYHGYRILDHDKQGAGWQPDDPEDFEFSIDFYAGSGCGADAFAAEVCSPRRFLKKHATSLCSPQGVLIMPSFDLVALNNFLRELCEGTEAQTWDALALKLNATGRWEFAHRT